MKNQSTWRFVLKIVGAALAVAGFVCLLIAYWDKLASCISSLSAKCRINRCECSEYEDYADDLLYE